MGSRAPERRSFDRDAAETCLSYLESLDCTRGWEVLYADGNVVGTSCQRAIWGNAAEGEPCVDDVDCASGSWCDSAEACPGSCRTGLTRPRVPAGEPCEQSWDCEPPLLCAEGFCAVGPDVGEPSLGEDLACREGLICKLEADWWGAVTVVQRCGSALQLMPHVHAIGSNGVFGVDRSGDRRMCALPAPSTEDVERVVEQVHGRVLALLRRRGLIADEHGDTDPDPLAAEDPALAGCYSARKLDTLAATWFAKLVGMGSLLWFRTCRGSPHAGLVQRLARHHATRFL